MTSVSKDSRQASAFIVRLAVVATIASQGWTRIAAQDQDGETDTASETLPEEPAAEGTLPGMEEEAGDAPPTAPEGVVDPSAAPPAAGADSQPTGEDAEEDNADADDSWESYSGSQSAVAKDVTGGVRVEDVVEPLTDYAYAAFGKPDPFIAPYFKHRNTNYSLEVPIVSVLQTYEIKELKVSGIWQSLGGERKALVMTHDGKVGVEVVKGDPIGKKAGKVLEVRPESVLIREYYLTRDGTREFEDIELLIPNDFSQKTGGTIVLTPDGVQMPKTEAAQATKIIETVKGSTIEKVEKAPAATQPAGSFLPKEQEVDANRATTTANASAVVVPAAGTAAGNVPAATPPSVPEAAAADVITDVVPATPPPAAGIQQQQPGDPIEQPSSKIDQIQDK